MIYHKMLYWLDVNRIHFLFQGHPKVVEKLKILLKKWSEEVFKNDPELSLIPSLYNSLKAEKGEFPSEPVSLVFYHMFFALVIHIIFKKHSSKKSKLLVVQFLEQSCNFEKKIPLFDKIFTF